MFKPTEWSSSKQHVQFPVSRTTMVSQHHNLKTSWIFFLWKRDEVEMSVVTIGTLRQITVTASPATNNEAFLIGWCPSYHPVTSKPGRHSIYTVHSAYEVHIYERIYLTSSVLRHCWLSVRKGILVCTKTPASPIQHILLRRPLETKPNQNLKTIRHSPKCLAASVMFTSALTAKPVSIQ